jgi:two-component system, response regulator YesN
MKCIIADDERLVRYSIQDMLEEIADAGVAWFDEISQVVNGKELLRQVRVLQPDLVFVDIRMPLLSGLDAIEKGRELSPRSQWVILTGYAEFDYAKRAIALGALDYLLKPASRSDIERMVRMALSRLADKRTQDQLALEHRILGLLQDTFSEDPESCTDTTYAGLLLTLDSSLSLRDASAMQKHALQNLRSWLRTNLPSSCTGGVAVLDDGNMVCILASQDNDGLEGLLQKTAGYSLATLVHELSQEAVCTVFHVKTNGADLTGLLKDLILVSKDSSLRIFGGLGQIIDAGLQESMAAGFNPVQNALTQVDRAMRNREIAPEETVQVLHRHRSELEQLWSASELCRFFEIRSTLALRQLEPVAALEACVDWCARGLLPGTSTNGTARRRQLVQRALDLLAEQYTREIGLAQLADSMGITPNYLSSEFNRVMGESFSQYVTRLRMKKADELLRQGGFTVKEVAASVGYVSSRHFASLFKKHFGHVPSEHTGG